MPKKETKLDKMLDISSEGIEKMSYSELRNNTKYLSKIANQRLNQIREDLTNPIIEQISEKYYTRNFGIRGMSEDSLREQYSSLINFLKSKYSSEAYWEKSRKEFANKFSEMVDDIVPLNGKEVRAFTEAFMSYETQVKFWEAYRKADERYNKHFAERHASDDVVTEFYQTLAQRGRFKNLSVEEMIDMVVEASKKQEEKEYKSRKEIFSNNLTRLGGSSNAGYSSRQSKSIRKKSK